MVSTMVSAAPTSNNNWLFSFERSVNVERHSIADLANNSLLYAKRKNTLKSNETRHSFVGGGVTHFMQIDEIIDLLCGTIFQDVNFDGIVAGQSPQ